MSNSIHLKKDIFLRDLLKQQYFGETSIFSSSNAIDFSVKSVEFTTIYKISRKKFLETIRKFPDDYVRTTNKQEDYLVVFYGKLDK